MHLLRVSDECCFLLVGQQNFQNGLQSSDNIRITKV